MLISPSLLSCDFADLKNEVKTVSAADMLEKGRTYDGVDKLRAAADKDFETGFKLALVRSYNFVKNSGKPIYGLTKKAINYYLGDNYEF